MLEIEGILNFKSVIELCVFFQSIFIQSDGYFLDDVRLQVNDLFNQSEHGLWYDMKDVSNVRHQLGGIMLRDGEQVGTVSLIDAHQR